MARPPRSTEDVGIIMHSRPQYTLCKLGPWFRESNDHFTSHDPHGGRGAEIWWSKTSGILQDSDAPSNAPGCFPIEFVGMGSEQLGEAVAR